MTIAATGLPFDDIRKLMQDLPVADLAAVAQFKARDAQLTKPPGALGKLESMAEWVAAWQGIYPPKIARPVGRGVRRKSWRCGPGSCCLSR
jgi:nicotinate-nucleotide--dimethylbenzimidazole phosphoribosyltransferase